LLKILVKCFRAGAVIFYERKYNIYEQEDNSEIRR